MTQAGQDRRAARLLALLAVLLGLLAMHGLASTHHAAASPPPTVTPSAAEATTADPDVSPEPVHHDSDADKRPGPQAQAAGADKGACDDCSTTVLCLAILTAAVAAAALTVRRTRGHVANVRTTPRPRASAAARHAPPAPDPVEELCISRT